MAFGTHWIPQTKSLFLALCGAYGPLPFLLTIGTEVFIRWGIIFKSRHLLMSWIIQWVYSWSQLFRIPIWNEWLINLGPNNLGPNNLGPKNLGPNLGPFVAPPKTCFPEYQLVLQTRNFTVYCIFRKVNIQTFKFKSIDKLTKFDRQNLQVFRIIYQF